MYLLQIISVGVRRDTRAKPITPNSRVSVEFGASRGYTILREVADLPLDEILERFPLQPGFRKLENCRELRERLMKPNHGHT